ETSDKNAQNVKELASTMNADVRKIVEALQKAAQVSANEARTAGAVVAALEARRDDMTRIAAGSRNILAAAMEAERAALQASSGAEQVASAAEEQSAGSSQAQSAVDEQAKSLSQAQS